MKWTPVKNNIIKDVVLKKTIHENGYAIIDNIGQPIVNKLVELFNITHELNYKDGGTFYSLFSKDIDYRLKIHNKINEILTPVYNLFFQNYKVTINSFIVKLSGPNSSFSLHQDSSGLDEFNFSPLSLWIPLQKTNLDNGTLCIIPKSHWLFYPYRGISITPPFVNYQDVLRRYLVPINLEAGDILVFDNRLVHYSHLNNSNHPRIVSLTGLFPKDAEIQICYKDESVENSPIEIFSQEEDFVITNTSFLEGSKQRPIGRKILEIYENPEPISVYDFLTWANKNNVTPTNIRELSESSNTMVSFSEPIAF